jgi:DNA modification methylase
MANIDELQLHPLSAKIYGENESLDGLVESIQQYGILSPIIITSLNQIVSGHRRFAAAKKAGLKEVPTILFPTIDPLIIEIAVIEANRNREKNNEQKAREYIERLRIESKLAEQRKKENGGVRRDKLYRQSDVENFPCPIVRQSLARALASSPIGWSDRTAEKAAKVIEYIDDTGDNSMTTLLNKSVNSAYASVKQKTGDGPLPPPFNPQYSNVWNFPRLTEGFGEKYPGNIPGDIIRNLLWYYTREFDLVIDLFAGGGVTRDVCNWWNKQPEVWAIQHLSFDLVPSRADIKMFDVTIPPYLPKESKDAGLIFLDPPYWKQKRGVYSNHKTNLANMSLSNFYVALSHVIKASETNLRKDGHLAIIIGATQDNGRFIDHTAFILKNVTAIGFLLVQRVIIPYTTQQFSGADIAQARKNRMMLKGYRDLLILKKAR